MTNEEITTHYNNTRAMSSIIDLLDLARADEREKLQGVDVWVSLDEHHAKLFLGGLKPENILGFHYCKSGKNQHSTMINRHAAKLLGVKQGECAKFKIVRCENET